MDNQKMRCMRCRGRKTVFKVGSGYSHTNTGGVEVDCPMCLGDGKVNTLESAINESAKKSSKKSSRAKHKDVEDAEEKDESGNGSAQNKNG